MRKVIFLLFFFSSLQVFSQVDFSVNAGMEIPATTGNIAVKSGIYADAGISVILPFLWDFRFLADIAYSNHSFADAAEVNFLSGLLGTGYNFKITETFSVLPRISAGYYYGWSSSLNSSGGNIILSPGLTLTYMFSRVFGANISSSYNMYFGKSEIFYSAVTVSLGLSVSPWNVRRKAKLEIEKPSADIIFPIYRYYYDTHPLGSVVITNKDKEPVKDITVKFFIPEYMSEPRICGKFSSLESGKSVTADLFALLNDEIFSIQEGKKTGGLVFVDYSFRGAEFSEKRSDTYRISFRNGMRWENDASAACFVTAKDPVILKIAKSISGTASTVEPDGLPENVIKTCGIYSFVKKSGIQYVVDPNSPYTEFSENSGSIDFLQFPVETLVYSGGDCDDLSILYSSILESMGIPAAFITVPGHIYIAFDSGISAEKFSGRFPGSPGFIEEKGNAWIPVEITLINKSFEKAWALGFSEWEKNPAERGFIVIQEAWKIYPPVQPVFEQKYDYSVDRNILKETIENELNTLSSSLFMSAAGPLLNNMRKNPENTKTAMQLGIVYARFGKYKEAETLFKSLYGKTGSSAVLINLGNIYLLKNNYSLSAEYFRKAWDSGRKNLYVAEALSQLYRETGNYTEADNFSSIAGEMAGTAAAGQNRGSGSTGMEGGLIWEETP